MDIGSIGIIYPNGIEPTGPNNPINNQIDTNVKEQALTLIRQGRTLKFVSNELNLKINTLYFWKSESKQEKY